MAKIFLIALLLMVDHTAPSSADAREMIQGPILAQIIKIRDGDSIDVVARVWPSHDVRVSVRIRGIDAPELRARCAAERELALRAKSELSQLIAGDQVELKRISGGKYYGRVLADVMTSDQRNIAKTLLKNGFVRPYKGGKRQSWCTQNLATN